MQFLLKQAGVDKRTGDLYGNRDLLNIARNMARGLKVSLSPPLCVCVCVLFFFFHHPTRHPVEYVENMEYSFCFLRDCFLFLQGVENVYTQHQPLVFQTMESIVKGRVRDVDYPFIGNHFQQARFVGSESYFGCNCVFHHLTCDN